jgi:hypothetical protein
VVKALVDQDFSLEICSILERDYILVFVFFFTTRKVHPSVKYSTTVSASGGWCLPVFISSKRRGKAGIRQLGLLCDGW